MIVTGAGQGIGAAVASAASERGDPVVLADLDADAIERVSATLPSDSLAVPTDVTDSGQLSELVSAALERFDEVGALVNAAGGFSALKATEDVTDAEWEHVVRLNLYGTFASCRAVIPHMKARGSGRIVNVASEAGRMPLWPGSAPYAAAKAGVIGFTRSLARELGEHGITVNAIAPGTTLTPRVKSLYTEQDVARIATVTPLGRLAEVEDQVGPIMFLTSEAARYVTGATLDVNGGRLML